MLAFIWPIALVVLSNTVYQICSKSMPPEVHPFASLTVTYLVGAVLSGVMFFVLNPGGNLLREYGKLNWAPFALGIVIVGLEVGFVYAYKAGWSEYIRRAMLEGKSQRSIAKRLKCSPNTLKRYILMNKIA